MTNPHYCTEGEETLRDIGLHLMNSLRYFRFQIFMESLDDWSYITVVLDNITSTAISHVEFSLHIYASAIPKESDLWTRIPSIIAKPDFKRLQKLEFDLVGGNCSISDVDEVDMWIS
jgi:hypothetical protein